MSISVQRNTPNLRDLQVTDSGRAEYLNRCEGAFADKARANGWAITKRGWPDFLCINPKNGEVIAVEVKPRLKRTGELQRLKKEQTICMEILSSTGIRCFISDGTQLVPYSFQAHGSKSIVRPSY